jgi:hypothetical protein
MDMIQVENRNGIYSAISRLGMLKYSPFLKLSEIDYHFSREKIIMVEKQFSHN